MKQVTELIKQVISFYKYLSDKRYSTISGTLVYFLLMSIAPFLFWLSILASNFDLETLMSHEIFSAVEPIILYLKDVASTATNGASVIL